MTTTCRDTAAAGKNPEPPMPPAPPAGPLLVRGTILRIADLRVSIREHQSGGTPIHAVPTRRAHPPRPPPTPGSRPPLPPTVPRGSSTAARRRQRRTSSLRCGRSTLTPLTPRRSPAKAPQGRKWGAQGPANRRAKLASERHLDKPFHIRRVGIPSVPASPPLARSHADRVQVGPVPDGEPAATRSIGLVVDSSARAPGESLPCGGAHR
jgi:hypothetical protein